MDATTLTDRYVEATLRRLPPGQRPDLERELRSSIADAIDDRVTAGEEPAAAEGAVLTGLGDPARLAAGYSSTPLHLIGPNLFLDYKRVLTALTVTVVPIVVTVVAVVRGLDGASPGTMAGGAIGAGITTAVHIAFWVTLLFAALERGGKSRAPNWTPDTLPAPPSRRMRYTELILESVATVGFSALILVSPAVGPKADATGTPVPILNPWLWESGVVYLFIALVVASLAVAFAKYHAGWRAPLALSGALVQIAPSILLIWLAANDKVINPAFLAAAAWPAEATAWIAPGLIIAGAAGILSVIMDSVRR